MEQQPVCEAARVKYEADLAEWVAKYAASTTASLRRHWLCNWSRRNCAPYGEK